MRACLPALLLVLAAMTITGCGQTGALYFDEDPPADQLPPSKKKPASVVVPQPGPAATVPAP